MLGHSNDRELRRWRGRKAGGTGLGGEGSEKRKVKRPIVKLLMWGGRNVQLKHMSQEFWILEGPRGHFLEHHLGFSHGRLTSHFKREPRSGAFGGDGRGGSRALWPCPGSERRRGLWGQWWAGPVLPQIVTDGPGLRPLHLVPVIIGSAHYFLKTRSVFQRA